MRKVLILLRGPSAVGKTAIAKNLLTHLKTRLKKNCAFISEDNFRKKMQFKYKAEDKIVHINSAKLIASNIEKLNQLDDYEIIIVEGLFRYKEMLEEYRKYAEKNNFKVLIFQLTAPLELRKKRNKLSKFRDHISDLNTKHGRGDTENIPLKNSIIINTIQSVGKSTAQIISHIRP